VPTRPAPTAGQVPIIIIIQVKELAMPAIKSLEDEEGLRCVDIIERADGTYTFKEFRKDREDMGRWLLVRDFSSTIYANLDETVHGAAARIPWLADMLRS
jgi:hypothetical protein